MKNRTLKLIDKNKLNYVIGNITYNIYTSNVMIIWDLKKVYILLVKRIYVYSNI